MTDKQKQRFELVKTYVANAASVSLWQDMNQVKPARKIMIQNAFDLADELLEANEERCKREEQNDQ